MSAFHVVLKTLAGTIEYDAIGASAVDVGLAALENQDKPCGVTVRPL